MKAALLFITCLLALFIMTNGNPEADSQSVDEALLFCFLSSILVKWLWCTSNSFCFPGTKLRNSNDLGWGKRIRIVGGFTTEPIEGSKNLVVCVHLKDRGAVSRCLCSSYLLCYIFLLFTFWAVIVMFHSIC